MADTTSTTSSATSPERFRVAIIGGGIGGLTLGALLRQLEIPFVILERAAVLTPQGAGISLAPNCLKVLEQLGLFHPYIKPNSQELLGIKVYREKRDWGTINFGLSKRWFGYNVHSIERHEFHHYLYGAAGGDKNVRLAWNVVDIVDDVNENSPVRVIADDGREIQADIVAGADGIRSVTRRILAGTNGLKGESSIRFTGRVHMSGYTKPLDHLSKTDLGVAHWMLYDDCILTTWPCKENRQWFIGVKRADLAPGETPDRSVWKHATGDTVNGVYGKKYHPFGKEGTVESIVSEAERVIASNVFEEKDFPHMYKGRVALLGDAAHSMTSFFGQGACQAIEDATILADSIFAFLEGDKAALEQYDRVRSKRAQEVASFSARYAQVHTARLPLGSGKLVRGFIYRVLPSSVWMWYLRWLYGYQPVSKMLEAKKKSDAGKTEIMEVLKA